MPPSFRRWMRLGVLLLAVGCGRSRTASDYVPETVVAQQQLQRALKAWRGGQAVDGWSGQPAVRFADSRAQAGRKLAEFEILGELPVDSGRRFQVRMRFAEPAETTKSQYVVFGIDPLWVVEQNDMNMITHWDHSMAPANDAKSPANAAESP